jgi:hypothetical protein
MIYLWDIRGLAHKIRQGKLSQKEVALYCFLSPFLSISSGIFFGFLLFSHQVIEYSFRGWLGESHPYTHFYNIWSATMSLLTITISFGGMYLCYRANKSGDGKNFWKRMACLSFPINFHIIVYTLASLSIAGIIFYFALQDTLASFQASIWPSETQTISDAGQPIIQTVGWFAKSLAFVKLPMAPLKLVPLFDDIRSLIMLGYPVLSFVPPLLSLSHYLIVRRMIKKVARIPEPKKFPKNLS